MTNVLFTIVPLAPLLARSDPGIIPFVILIPFAVLALISALGKADRDQRFAQEWADEHQLSFIEFSRVGLFGGPWFFRRKGTTVYRFSAARADGSVVSGWLRVGGIMSAWFGRAVAVKWEVTESSPGGFAVIFPENKPVRFPVTPLNDAKIDD